MTASFGNGFNTSYQYDDDDNLISQSNNNAATYTWSYDENGNVTDYYDLISNKHFTYVYDDDGKLESLSDENFSIEYSATDDSYTVKYKNGSTVKTQTTVTTTDDENEDENGIAPVTTVISLISEDTLTYTNSAEDESTKSIKTGESEILSEKYTVDDNRVSKIEYIDGKTIEYSYNVYGNIAEIKENGTVTVSYEYDLFDQLIRENNSKTNTTTVYSYDNSGNILTKTKYAYTTGELGTAVSTVNYGYNNAWKDLLTNYNGQPISYDEIGNPLFYRSNIHLTWSSGRQLATFQTDNVNVSYEYDSRGIRTSKSVDGVTTTYYLEGTNIISETTNSATKWYMYDSTDSIIGFEYNNVPYYFEKNAQGDVVRIYSRNGVAVCEYSYDAWGNCTISGNTTIANANPFRYRGYYYDTESGFYYLQSRYYDPVVGRFLNADNCIGMQTDGIETNLFTYCLNNYITYVDFSGNAAQPKKYSSEFGTVPSNKKVYVLYYSNNKNHRWFHDQAYDNYNYDATSPNTKIIGVKTAKRFFDEWNKIPNDVDHVFLLFHGETYALNFYHEEINAFKI